MEARILELVARLYPGVFQALDEFCARHAGYLDETIRVSDQEIQFYVAYLDFIAPMKAAGLEFCFPAVSAASKPALGGWIVQIFPGRIRVAPLVTSGLQGSQ